MKVYQNGAFKTIDNTATKIGHFTLGFEFQQLSDNIPSWALPYLGGEYLRSSYPDLWEYVQQKFKVITDEEWLALEAANPSGSVGKYSSGDGSTTFRVPKVNCLTLGANNLSEVGEHGNTVSNLIAENDDGEIINNANTSTIKIVWCVKALLDVGNDPEVDINDYVNMTNPSLTLIYEREEGDESDNVSLTQPYTDFKGLLLIYSNGTYTDTKIKWSWELDMIANGGGLSTSDTGVIDESTLIGAYLSKVYGIN